MRQTFRLIATLLFIITTGCGSTALPVANSPLVGKWTGTATCGQGTLDFSADGSAVFSEMYYCSGSTVVQWSVSGSKLIVETGTAFGTVAYDMTIDGNSMIWVQNNHTYTWTRN